MSQQFKKKNLSPLLKCFFFSTKCVKCFNFFDKMRKVSPFLTKCSSLLMFLTRCKNCFHFFSRMQKLILIFDKMQNVFPVFQKRQKMFHFLRENAKRVSIFLTLCETSFTFLDKMLDKISISHTKFLIFFTLCTNTDFIRRLFNHLAEVQSF